MSLTLQNPTYLAYGARISSSLPLADLPDATGSPDIRIRTGSITPELVAEVVGNAQVIEGSSAKFIASSDAVYLQWNGVGKVIVSRGYEVVVDPEPGVKPADLCPFLTGPVMAVLLHQRGHFVLHASCVGIGESAVAFIAPKGSGKSTIAGYLKSRGHRLVSDDIVPLFLRAGAVWTNPGFPRVKLYDDSIEAIGGVPSHFPRIHRFVEKRSCQFGDSFYPEPIEITRLCLLSQGREIKITSLSKGQAFIELMRNTHLSKFLEATNCQSRYFRECKEIVQRVPVFNLERPDSFASMSDIAEWLEHSA